MSTGTVTLHSWSGNPNATEDDCDDHPLGANYNARLDRKEEFDVARRGVRPNNGASAGEGSLGGRRTLRSHAVWGRRRGAGGGQTGGVADEEAGQGGAGW